jgi:hypothetical protein
MKLHLKLALGLAVLALGLVPAVGVADGPNYQPEGPSYQPEKPPQPPKGTPPQGKAYGYYCKGQSKKHVKGEKGTAFSRCVKAMKQADKNENLNPKKACKGLSKKHVKGKGSEKGTPFSRCVKAVNKMRQEEKAAENATVTTSSVV